MEPRDPFVDAECAFERGFAARALLHAWPALLVAAVAIASVVGRMTHHCGSACDTLCVVVCGAGGLIAGVVVGTAAKGDVRRALASIVCAGLMGALGCTALGLFAVVGMAAALCSGCA